MYNEFFGFSEAPFSIAPDPRYLFMSERHREALAHLTYGLGIDGGFVLLSGEVGTGKTTICRCLLEQVPGDCDIAFLLNPKLDTLELLATLCDELHIAPPDGPATVKTLVDRINRHLLAANAQGRKTVVIVDEAQNLSSEVLEQLRLLTNLETNTRKLLQIILLGQPELRDILARTEMRQLAQRIVARYHLEPLSRPELEAYVAHRLAVAGSRQALFPAAVMDRLYRLSEGTPRLINLICDRALLGAYVENKAAVDLAILNKAAAEVLGEQSRPLARRPLLKPLTAALLLAAGAALAIGVVRHLPGPETTAALPERAVATAGSPPATASPTVGLATEPVIEPGADAGSAVATMPVVAGSAESGPVPEGAPEPAAGAIGWPDPASFWLHEVGAVRELFRRWGVEVAPVSFANVCRVAAEKGLSCLQQGQGDLALLQALNVPAVVELRQEDGAEFFATLTALDGERVELALAGTTQIAAREHFGRQWSGSFVLLWKNPPGWYRTVAAGARGDDVAWVIRQLDRWEGLPEPEAGGNLFTAAVAQRVRAFQRSHGLPEDGVIGRMTMVRLAAVAYGDAPVLARQAH